MSAKAVQAVHGPTVEDYIDVATPDDIAALEKKLIDSSMAVYALVEKNRINLEQMMIDTIETIKKRMKEDIFATLEDGQWKKTFKQNVEDALSQLEKRFEEMNKALSRKMAEIPDNDATEKRIMSILIAYGETIKKIIEEEGSRVCKQAQQQKQRNDLLSALEQEAWTITWGHYDDGTK